MGYELKLAMSVFFQLQMWISVDYFSVNISYTTVNATFAVIVTVTVNLKHISVWCVSSTMSGLCTC